MNTNKMAKEWLLPAVIIFLAFTLLPTAFETWFAGVIGPMFGTATGYVLSFMVALIVVWTLKYAKKQKVTA